MFSLIVVIFQIIHYFAFKVTLVTCVFDTVMFGPVVLFCLVLIFGSEVTHVALNYLVTVDIHNVCFQPG